jgi:hypothetical protein
MIFQDHIPVIRVDMIDKGDFGQFGGRISEQLFSPEIGEFYYPILSDENGIVGILD